MVYSVINNKLLRKVKNKMKVVLEHVTKRFPNRNKKIKKDVIAVSDLTFEVPDGKLVALLGPSGCGGDSRGQVALRKELSVKSQKR